MDFKESLDQAEETSFGKKFKTEYGTWLMDFQRLNSLYIQADYCGVQVRCFNSENIMPYYSLLKQIYMIMRPIFYKEVRMVLEKDFILLYQEVMNFEKRVNNSKGKSVPIPFALIDKLDSMCMALNEAKQLAGMGYPITFQKSINKKLEAALLGGLEHETENKK